MEAEAYLGPHNDPPDPAAHSHRGPTPRNLVLFGPAGHAYVYAIYGRYFCMNISCESRRAGRLRAPARAGTGRRLHQMAAESRPCRRRARHRLLTSGPSRLCQALGLTRSGHNGLDFTSAASPLQVRDDGFAVPEVLVTPRIGIKQAMDWPLRFAFQGTPASPVREFNRPRVFPG